GRAAPTSASECFLTPKLRHGERSEAIPSTRKCHCERSEAIAGGRDGCSGDSDANDCFFSSQHRIFWPYLL
ncbi:MAG: hypothetical protein NZT92_20465, partial [Abditibacteriales bacterium]|nr:hypothetical protein [Abditibacteriales bacterium]MDW8368124.1 hypothetical protein [Abditibacteriales bacterium]